MRPWAFFPQQEILTVTRAYDTLVSQRDRELDALEFSQDLKEQWEERLHRYDADIASALDRLKVEVYAMEGRDLFAKIETGCSPENAVFRTLSFTDFQGNPVHDIEAERLNLTPPHVHKDLDQSFFESHIQQIPELLKGLCDAVFNDKKISLAPHPAEPECPGTPVRKKSGRIETHCAFRYGNGLSHLRFLRRVFAQTTPGP